VVDDRDALNGPEKIEIAPGVGAKVRALEQRAFVELADLVADAFLLFRRSFLQILVELLQRGGVDFALFTLFFGELFWTHPDGPADVRQAFRNRGILGRLRKLRRL